MMLKVKLTAIGKSRGVILPEKALSRLKLGNGDELFFPETKDGYLLMPCDPELKAQMRDAADITVQYRNTLKELAK